MYLSRLCFIYPYFIDVFDLLLESNKPSGKILELVEKEINSIAKEHIKYSRSDVSLWSVYLAIKYDFIIDDFEEFSDFLISDRDCLPVLMSYEYAKAKKLKTKNFYDFINTLVTEKTEEEWWIYIYTLYSDSHRKVVFKKIAFKEFYEEMRKGKVKFLKK
jgi:hypothetical protein